MLTIATLARITNTTTPRIGHAYTNIGYGFSPRCYTEITHAQAARILGKL